MPIWIVGSRSDGLGFKGAGSNRGRRFSIEWLRAITAIAAAGIAGGLFPAAARHRRCPIRHSGGYLGWGLAVELYCGMGNPPRGRVGFGEVRSTKFGDHGGSGRRSSPACSAWAPLWATGYVNSCNRKSGYGRGSPGTELDGEVAQRRRRRSPAAMKGGARGRGGCGGPLDFQLPRINSRRPCGSSTENQGSPGSPEVRN